MDTVNYAMKGQMFIIVFIHVVIVTFIVSAAVYVKPAINAGKLEILRTVTLLSVGTYNTSKVACKIY